MGENETSAFSARVNDQGMVTIPFAVRKLRSIVAGDILELTVRRPEQPVETREDAVKEESAI